MRKLLVVIWLMTLTMVAGAGPAIPRPVKMVQPDGSTIVVRIHGDEYFSWYTSEDGRTVYEMGEDKWLRPSSMHSVRQKRTVRPKAQMGYWGNNGNGLGNRRIPVILVEFSDKYFQDGAVIYFNRALNEPGFSENGQYGSVKDYFTEASYGLFTPTFDVYGPVRLERSFYERITGDGEKNFLKASILQNVIPQSPSLQEHIRLKVEKVEGGCTFFSSIEDPSQQLVLNYADESSRDWSITGTMVTPQWDTNASIPMTLEGDLWVARRVSLSASDKFKFIYRHSWDVNRGGNIQELGTSFPLTQNGPDILPGVNGIVDIYMSADSYSAFVVLQ